MRALLFAYLVVVVCLAGCTRGDGPGTDATTTETGTEPTVPREIAVSGVTATQDGPDVLFAVVAPVGVTRSLDATVTWSSKGWTYPLFVALLDGVAVTAQEIVAPCDMLGTTQPIVVRADGRDFEVLVELDGTVQEHITVGTHTGLVASCRDEPVVLDAYPGVYELSSPGALLYGGGDSGQGYSAFSFRTVQYLGGRYELTWRAEPHYLMARMIEE